MERFGIWLGIFLTAAEIRDSIMALSKEHMFSI